MVFSAIRSSFSTTLPLHVQGVFHWGSLPAGLMFAALQGPSFILSPFVGWLKDRIGTREPTTLGFAILAPLFWLIGTPGDERFPWANENNRGPLIYTMTILGIGIVSTLLNGSGTIEATCMSKDHCFVRLHQFSLTLFLCSDCPRIGEETPWDIRSQRRILESYLHLQHGIHHRLVHRSYSLWINHGSCWLLRDELLARLVYISPVGSISRWNHSKF